MISIAGSELADAKDKLSKADSSSSDSDEDTPHKRKKPITHADKPSEEVSVDVKAWTGAALTLFISHLLLRWWSAWRRNWRRRM